MIPAACRETSSANLRMLILEVSKYMSNKLLKTLKFLASGKFWLTSIKVFLIAFVLFMVAIQIPELRYDALGKRPVIINSAADLVPELLGGSSYAKIAGTANFDSAFVYERYGLSYIYFTLDPYGIQIVARAYGTDSGEWDKVTLFEGKLRPFDSQPFSYVIRDIFADQNDGQPPAPDAFYLGVGDVPAANAWQIGSMIFALLMLAAMVYFFFFFHRSSQLRIFSDPLDYLNKGISGTGDTGETSEKSKESNSEPVEPTLS